MLSNFTLISHSWCRSNVYVSRELGGGVMMWTLAIPAVICFFIKSFLIFRSWHSLAKNSFSALLLICTLHSLAEICIIFSVVSGSDSEFMFRTYYIVSSWCLGMALIYILDFSNCHTNFKYLTYTATIFITGLFFLTDIIISGYTLEGHIITAIKSPNYWVFSLFAVTCIFSSVLLLLASIRQVDSLIKKVKALYLLLGLVAPFIGVLAILSLIQMGININAVAIIPVLTLAFFIFIIASESTHEISDIRRFLPWSPESKLASEVINIVNQSTLRKKTYRETKKEIDIELLKYYKSLTKSEKKSKVQKDFGMSSSTWHSALERGGIKDK